MTDMTVVIGEAAAVVDPLGESEDVSILCGLIAWAVEHPDQYSGWDVQTLSAALRWNFRTDPDEADETARRLAPDWGD